MKEEFNVSNWVLTTGKHLVSQSEGGLRGLPELLADCDLWCRQSGEYWGSEWRDPVWGYEKARM